jgi:hypothetical protein
MRVSDLENPKYYTPAAVDWIKKYLTSDGNAKDVLSAASTALDRSGSSAASIAVDHLVKTETHRWIDHLLVISLLVTEHQSPTKWSLCESEMLQSNLVSKLVSRGLVSYSLI